MCFETQCSESEPVLSFIITSKFSAHILGLDNISASYHYCDMRL